VYEDTQKYVLGSLRLGEPLGRLKKGARCLLKMNPPMNDLGVFVPNPS